MAQERSDLETPNQTDPASRGFVDEHSGGKALERNAIESSGADAMDLSTGDNVPEAAHIKGQINDTRNQMGETIDAIQDKLSFSNISEQVSEHVNNAVVTAKEAVYDATIGKAADIMKNVSTEFSNSKIVKTAKNNPLPFVLIGVGAGLLAYKGYAGTLNPRHARHEFTGPQDRSSAPRSSIDDTAPGTFDNVTSKVTEAAGTAIDKVSGALDTARVGAGDVVNRAYSKVDDLRSTAQRQYETYLNENPLALGAAALALGAAVGMAIPATRYEGQLLGETRDDFLDKAQDTASGLLDKTKQAISDKARTITAQKGSMIEH